MLAGSKWCLSICVVFKCNRGILSLRVSRTNEWELFLSHLPFFCLLKDWRRWDDLHRRYYFSTGGYFTSIFISAHLGFMGLCFTITVIIFLMYCYLVAFRLSCGVWEIFSRVTNLKVVCKLLLIPLPTIKVHALWTRILLLQFWDLFFSWNLILTGKLVLVFF